MHKNPRIVHIHAHAVKRRLPLRRVRPLLQVLVEIRGESDGPALARRRIQELTNRGEHGGNGLVVRGELLLEARFQLAEALGEFPVGDEQLAQLLRRRTLRPSAQRENRPGIACGCGVPAG
jgi:hypothetical protein